ncbi:MAG: hypothetical protein B7X53_18695 [Hyphomonas sp. 34-62-18]|nr:hypothetical protein [Hyphomonas sp. 34-62-18]OZB11527.1 MAG: hypothetical protein B7X53_18695 [Hyphomonas sp. 34-62-18]
MTTRLAIFPLISAAWGGAIRALVPAAPWIALFALAAGLYSFGLPWLSWRGQSCRGASISG